MDSSANPSVSFDRLGDRESAAGSSTSGWRQRDDGQNIWILFQLP